MVFTCKQIITLIFPKVEVRMKMQTKGLYLIKEQKSPDEDGHEQNQ